MPNLLRLSLAHGVDALRHASEQLDLAVADRAVQALLDCSGRRYFTGIGKSGHSAARMASSLSSIGLAAHWVHGTEWSHGELGALGAGDLIFAVSQSGSTQELVWLAEQLQASQGGVSMLSLTGDAGSPLAQRSELALTSAVPPELETLGALPTSSLLAQHHVFNALLCECASRRDLTAADVLRNHPGGAIGASLRADVDLASTCEVSRL